MQKEKHNALGFSTGQKKKRLNPDELSEKMGQCSYEFEEANRQIRLLEEEHQITRLQKNVGTILACKKWELLENPIARDRYRQLVEEGLKPTKDIIEDFTFLELEEIMSQYHYYETIAKQAIKEYEMWQGQLFKYQSEWKKEAAEMLSLGSHSG